MLTAAVYVGTRTARSKERAWSPWAAVNQQESSCACRTLFIWVPSCLPQQCEGWWGAVSEIVGTLLSQDWEFHIFHEVSRSGIKDGFVYTHFSSVFVAGTKASKSGYVCVVGAECSFVLHRPRALFFSFGPGAAYRSYWDVPGSGRFGKSIDCFG